jgi:Zn-dependent peptidase ImmA (M78 family)
MIPEAEAQKFLEELGITKLPVIPRDICRKLGIFYSEKPLKNIDGYLIVEPKSGNGFIGVNSSTKEPGRRNFTGAHELGHFCLDSFNQSKSKFYCSKDAIESRGIKVPPIELRANKFAAELLMLTHIYRQLVNGQSPGWHVINELASMSETSLLSTALRFVELTDYACALIVSESSQISWFNKSKMFSAYIDMDSKILSTQTYAFKASKGLTPPNEFEIVKADNWVSGRGVKPHTEMLEWTLPINSYGQILTILLDEEGIGGWEENGYEVDDDGEVEWEPPTFHKSKRKR